MIKPIQSQIQSTLALARVAAWEWNLVTNDFTRSSLHDHLLGHPEGIKSWGIQTFQKYIHPDDYDTLAHKFRWLSEANNEIETEFRVIWPDKSVHWLWTRAVVTQWLGKKPKILSGVTMDITSKKQAEAELEVYRRRIEKAQKIAGLGYGEIDYKTGEFFWSDMIYNLFGLDPMQFDLTIENFFKLLPVEERKEYKRLFTRARLSGKPFDHTFKLIKPNGETGYFRERAEFIQNEQGKTERITGIILDVTNREKTKLEIQEYRQRLEKAQEIARIGYWEYDYRDCTLHWSDKVFEMFGIEPDTFELTLAHFMELVHPDDLINLKIAQEHALHDDALFESQYRLIKPGGETGHFQERGEFIRDEHGRIVKLTGAVIDITTLKKTESQLLKSEQTYRLLFRHNPLPGFIYDLDTLEILEVNHAAIEFYGYKESEFAFMALEKLYPSEDLPMLYKKLSQIDPKFSASGEWTHIAKNGKRYKV